MKKNLCVMLRCQKNVHLRKIWMTMKLTMVLFFLAITRLMATEAYSQTARMTLHLEDATVKEVLSKIEDNSEFFFLYNGKLVDVNRKVSVDVNDQKISEILSDLFRETDACWTVVDRQIVLTDKANQNSFAQLGSQQQLKITGTVTDEKGNTLPGVTVLLKGTTLGSLTDASGKYTINNTPKNATLIFSFIGMKMQEILSDDRMLIDVVLIEEAIDLEEVVVVGYGTTKKVTLTGAVSSVKGNEILHSSAINVTNSLIGRLPGLTTVTRTGEPGNDGATLRIRGSNTLGNNDPLIVVDGIAGRGLERINPADIESINILKDASAAIYGAQAANGVILVTTKRGIVGKPKISIDVNRGFNQPTRIPKMADASQYTTMINEMAFYNNPSGGRYQKYSAEDIQKYSDGSDPWGHPNTDWFKEVFKPWSSQNYENISLTGGTESIKYFTSLASRFEDGVYKNSNTNYHQYDFRSNIDAKVSKNISVNLDLSGRQESRKDPYSGAGHGTGAIFRSLLRGLPNAPAYWPNGFVGPDYQEFGENPVVTSTDAIGYSKYDTYSLESNLKTIITIPWVQGLSVQGNASFDKSFYASKSFGKPWYLYNWDGNADHILTKTKSGLLAPELSQAETNGQRITLNAYATYERTIGSQHKIKLMAGTERQTGYSSNFSAFRKNFISTGIDELFAGAVDSYLTNTGSSTHSARLNYFGRFNYDYSEKYLFEFVWRYDGSYMFPVGKQFGFFPGISAGWRISQEKFWKYNITFLDDLKFNASWGQTGNDRIDEFQYLSSFGFVDNSWYVFNVSNISKMLNELRIPNPDVTWEVANQSNFGFDAKFFNKKLSVGANYFSNMRSNILYWRNASVPSSSGLTLPRQNIGKVSNRGFEMVISYMDKIGEFTFNVSANASYSKNKIVFWDETPGVPDYQQSTGRPMGAALNYQAIGIFKDQAAVDAYPHWAGAQPGDVIFKDVNGDGVIDGLDMVRDNKTDMPTFIGAFNIDLQYKQFDLTLLFQGAAGAEQRIYVESGTGGNYYKEYADNRWTPENTITAYPKAWDFQTQYWATQTNTFWLRSNDYLRLKNFEIGYSFTPELINRLGIGGCRIYVNGVNLLTLCKNKLIDPEVSGGQTYPLQRTLNGGLKLTF